MFLSWVKYIFSGRGIYFGSIFWCGTFFGGVFFGGVFFGIFLHSLIFAVIEFWLLLGVHIRSKHFCGLFFLRYGFFRIHLQVLKQTDVVSSLNILNCYVPWCFFKKLVGPILPKNFYLFLKKSTTISKTVSIVLPVK